MAGRVRRRATGRPVRIAAGEVAATAFAPAGGEHVPTRVAMRPSELSVGPVSTQATLSLIDSERKV